MYTKPSKSRTHLCPCQQCPRVSMFPHPHQHWACSVFGMLSYLMAVILKAAVSIISPLPFSFKSLNLVGSFLFFFFSKRKGMVWMEHPSQEAPGNLVCSGRSLGRQSRKTLLTKSLAAVGLKAQWGLGALLTALQKTTEASRPCGPHCLSITWRDTRWLTSPDTVPRPRPPEMWPMPVCQKSDPGTREALGWGRICWKRQTSRNRTPDGLKIPIQRDGDGPPFRMVNPNSITCPSQKNNLWMKNTIKTPSSNALKILPHPRGLSPSMTLCTQWAGMCTVRPSPQHQRKKP